MNFTKPCYYNLEYLRLCNGKTVFKISRKYYTQCMLQMAVTGTIKNYFAVWTPHRIIIEIYFDNEFWWSMENKFQKYYEHIFLRSSFNG